MPESMSSRDDEHSKTLSSVIARTREGEPSALAQLYSRYSGPLMRLAWRLTRSKDDAEDVLHDVFVGLPEALRHYDERGTFESWIKRVTARIALSSIRARQRSRELPLDDYPLIQSADRADSEADSAPIQRAVDSLPESMRLVPRSQGHGRAFACRDLESSRNQPRCVGDSVSSCHEERSDGRPTHTTTIDDVLSIPSRPRSPAAFRRR